MADGYISAVQLPGDNTYDIKDKNAVTEIQINGTAQTKTNGVVNLPAYPSDTKVTQGNTTASGVRPLVMEYNSYVLTEGADNNIETGYNSSNVTNQVYRTNNIYASPANGRLYLSSTATPQMYLKYRTLDYTLANNGMSSEQWVGYRVVDKNGKVVALFNLDVFPDGKIGAFVRAGNYNSTTSSNVSGYMGVFAHKDGSVSYSISHKDKFREAIEVYSKLETETPIRSYLTSTVGHACKNLFDMDKINQSVSGISNISITQSTGSLSFTGTGAYKAINITDTELGVQRYGKTYTVSCINNLVTTTDGKIAIIKITSNQIVKSASFTTTGIKTITFTPDETTFPDGWYISILATLSTSTTGNVDISQLMLRESTILDDTFEPYEEPTDLRAIKVKQSLNAQKKYYPLLFSSAEYSNSTSDIIDTVGRTNNTFIYPYSGWVYAGGGFCAGATASSTGGKRCCINVNGITANNYKADYSIAAYERQIIQAYAGKCSDANGLLLKIDSGGLTIVGGGESGANLAGLIADDQTVESPARLDINNSQEATGKETTALQGSSEHLILSSDSAIYFATGCNTIANRVAVCLNNSRIFYPMTNNTGSIGSSSYRWANGYFTNINGVAVGNSPKFTDNNTTYTFEDGTNGFTVTPSGGAAQTVTVTPSIANNITGSGTSGYLVKFNGTNTITSGPQLGSGTTTYLRNDGTWKTPTNTKNTAGSTNISSKIFLIGATEQSANPQTYSHDTAYIGTDGHLYSNSIQAVNLSDSQTLTNKTLQDCFFFKTKTTSSDLDHPDILLTEEFVDTDKYSFRLNMTSGQINYQWTQYNGNTNTKKVRDTISIGLNGNITIANDTYTPDTSVQGRKLILGSGSVQTSNAAGTKTTTIVENGITTGVISATTTTSTNIYTNNLYSSGSAIVIKNTLSFASGTAIKMADKIAMQIYKENNVNCLAVGIDTMKVTLYGSSYYLSSGAAITSDKRLKTNIEIVDNRYLNLIKNLEPKRFKLKNNPEQKYHTGFIAQDVQELLKKYNINEEEFAAFAKPKGDDSEYALSYTEFIPLLLLYIKDLEKQIKEIKEQQ